MKLENGLEMLRKIMNKKIWLCIEIHLEKKKDLMPSKKNGHFQFYLVSGIILQLVYLIKEYNTLILIFLIKY